jgi:hypothetical protein
MKSEAEPITMMRLEGLDFPIRTSLQLQRRNIERMIILLLFLS